MFKKFYYIAEISLPSSSAYSIHVLKMCDSFVNFGFSVSLLIPHKSSSYNFINIKKEYNLKNNFTIVSILKNKINSFYRIIFSFNVLRILLRNNANSIIISRSIISSIFLSLFQIKNYLELHHDLKGFTKFLFILTNLNFVKKNLKLILIHKNLLNYYSCFDKQDYIILDDAVTIEYFIKYKNDNLKKKKHRICAYFGSSTYGKGLEIIQDLLNIVKNVTFHIYTDLNLFDKKNFKKYQNIKFFDYVSYALIPKTMSKYDIVLMPYQKFVRVRSSNLETSNFMSPLKLFDYLASCKIIVASNLMVYSHILKDRHNSILLNPKNIQSWAKTITNIFNNYNEYRYLKKNAFNTAKNYTWNDRVRKIISFNKKPSVVFK